MQKHLILNRYFYIYFKNFKNIKQQITINIFILVKDSNNSKLLYKNKSNILINIIDIIDIDLNF